MARDWAGDGLVEPCNSPLFGPRVELRFYSDDDGAELSDLIAANVAHLAPWMRWIAEEPSTPAQRQALIDGWRTVAAEHRGATYGCFLAGTLIGSCGIHRREPVANRVEIGYWLDADHEAKGYATELTLLLCEEAFNHDEIDEVVIYCDDANERSARVAQRAGFAFDSIAPSPPGNPSSGESGLERRYVIDRGSFDAAWRVRFSPSTP